MGDDGGRPRRNVAPVRYQFEPELEAPTRSAYPVRRRAPCFACGVPRALAPALCIAGSSIRITGGW